MAEGGFNLTKFLFSSFSNIRCEAWVFVTYEKCIYHQMAKLKKVKYRLKTTALVAR